MLSLVGITYHNDGDPVLIYHTLWSHIVPHCDSITTYHHVVTLLPLITTWWSLSLHSDPITTYDPHPSERHRTPPSGWPPSHTAAGTPTPPPGRSGPHYSHWWPGSGPQSLWSLLCNSKSQRCTFCLKVYTKNSNVLFYIIQGDITFFHYVFMIQEIWAMFLLKKYTA